MAAPASVCAVLPGTRPPPASTMPPTAVSPEMALVTDMRGECRAGETPHTVWYPQMEASPNFETIEEKAGEGDTAPRPTMHDRPIAADRQRGQGWAGEGQARGKGAGIGRDGSQRWVGLRA
jgi:hypothetical protein